MVTPTVSVVIPTLNAATEIDDLLGSLVQQTLMPVDIIVIDSQSDDDTVSKAKKYDDVRVIEIRRSEFNHGLTRHFAAMQTCGDYICFLTQDAVPSDEHYLENLVAPMLRDSEIALVSARQIPKKDARRFEQLVRNFNYHEQSSVRSKADLSKYGIKTFFASDACSAYRRSAYAACGGFPQVNTNEDMLMAALLIAAGWKVAYEPSASVYHSHNLTLKQQYNRNKQIGFFLQTHTQELLNVSEIGEGKRLVIEVAKQLIKERRFAEFTAFGFDCMARLAGNRAGRKDALRSEHLENGKDD